MQYREKWTITEEMPQEEFDALPELKEENDGQTHFSCNKRQ